MESERFNLPLQGPPHFESLTLSNHKKERNHPQIPVDRVISHELEIYGSHGMQAFCYEDVFAMIRSGNLNPGQLVGKTITLAEVVHELPRMHQSIGTGITVVDMRIIT